MVDLHSHVMYGWDDGADTLDESLDMARIAADGIRALAATPHMWWGGAMVDPDIVRERVAEINDALARDSVPLTIITGTEIPASWENLELIRQKRVLSLNDSHTVLFEVPFHDLPVRLDDLIFQVRMLGLTPLMAHPERSSAFLADPDAFRRLIHEDVPVQINGGSLTGYFGEEIQDLAWEIVAQERPVVIASDAHNARGRSPMLSEVRASLEEAFGPEAADLMCRENAAALIEDRSARVADITRPSGETKAGVGSVLRRVFRRRG